MERTYTLTISCPDRVGIVAKVSNFLAMYGGWITEANHHSDLQANRFFMRHEIRAASLPFGLEEFRTAFGPIAREYEMDWDITDSATNKKVVLMCSKESHCMVDLLHRWQSGELVCDIPLVISNHETLRELVEWHGIPFHYVPVNKDNKPEAYAQVEQLIDEAEADCVVLARYMQIIPPALCDKYQHRIINIHHSFLPSFAGAKPYHQAYERGVKLIGATCHYVTEELDAGPIIDQDTVRVNHRQTAADMVRLGRDVEKSVLARGLAWHLQDRVLVYGNKTVVFN